LYNAINNYTTKASTLIIGKVLVQQQWQHHPLPNHHMHHGSSNVNNGDLTIWHATSFLLCISVAQHYWVVELKTFQLHAE